MKKAIQPFLLLICILLFAVSAKAELSSNLQIQKEVKPKTNKVALETYVDSQGNPVVASDKGYAQKEYLYNASNQLKEVRFLDVEGKLTNCVDGYATVTYEYKLNKIIRTAYTDAAGQSAVGPDGYAVQEVNRGTRGLELDVYEYDATGKLLTHSVTEYVDIKKDNLVKSKTWYNDQNEMTTGSEGYAKVEYEYFKRKKCHITYYNADGSLYYNPKVKYAEKEQIYEKGNISEQNYYGEGRAPIAGPEGFASAKYTYAQGGKETLIMYYNADGAPFFTKNGYCGIRQIKENRRVVDESYYSDEGVRGRSIEGYSRTTKRYTLRGQILQQCYYDENDHLMIPEEIGYAKIRNTYSTRFLLKTEYFDENEKPAYCLDGYAVAVHSYADKLRTDTVFYDTDGKTIINGKNGYAKIVYLYDDNKQNIGEAYYDVDGNRAVVSGEADEIRTTKDKNGNTTSISYWKNGESDSGEEGCHEIRMEYTADNKLKKETFHDANGHLTVSIYGYAGIEKLYNSAKRVMATLYYDENGELMTTPEKEYAYVLTIPEEDKKALDAPEEGEEEPEEAEDEEEPENENAEDEDIITGTVYVEYYGTDRKLMNLSSGYAYIIRQTDEQGRAVRENYYDKDGKRAVLKNGYDEIRQEFYTESWRPGRTEYYLNGVPVLYNDNYAAIEREYDENWNIIGERYFDTDFQPAACKNGYEAIRKEFNEDKQIIAEAYYDHNGQPMTNQKGVYRTAYDYNENGKTTKEAYFDAEGNPMLCTDGYAGYGKIFNEQGRALATLYYNEAGELMLASGKEYAYTMTIPKAEKEGTTEEEKNPNQTFCVKYYGTDGKLMNLKAGYAYVIRTYDEQGRTIREIYFDKDGNRALLDGEYDEIRQTYIENNKKPNRIEYYQNDAPVMRSTGYAAVEREYDEAGNTIKEKYYDTALQPTASRNGYETVRREYNDNKRVIAEAYYDHNDQPMTNTKGVYRTAYDYNENGKTTKEAYFDADGIPMMCPDGYAGIERIYNAQGGTAATLYYNETGELMLAPGKAYAYMMTIPQAEREEMAEEEDSPNQTFYIEYYGTDGELMNLSYGYACVKRTMDEQGRTVREIYFDKDGNRARIDGEFDEVRQVYTDNNKKPFRIEYYQNDESVLRSMGYSAVEREYDDAGNIITEKYYDTSFQPTSNNKGYEMIQKEYDENGRISREAYFDHAGDPMINNRGVYQTTYQYNAIGKVTQEAYYDAEGKPMANQNGYFMVGREYDEDGNKISETNYFTGKEE